MFGSTTSEAKPMIVNLWRSNLDIQFVNQAQGSQRNLAVDVYAYFDEC